LDQGHCVVPFECSSAGIWFADVSPVYSRLPGLLHCRPCPSTFRWGLPGLPSLILVARPLEFDASLLGQLISGLSIRLALTSVLRSSVRSRCEFNPRHLEIFWYLTLGLELPSPSIASGGSTSVQYISAVFGLFMYSKVRAVKHCLVFRPALNIRFKGYGGVTSP
jgi:hypothetical protein